MIRSGLKRRTGIRKVNRKRKAARFAKNFGEKAAWIREMPCAVTVCQYREYSWTEAAHVKSRGAGGSSAHLAPLCAVHHGLQHAMGIASFEREYDVNLRMLAAELEARWQTEGKGSE